MKPFKICILLVLVLIVQAHLSHNTAKGERNDTNIHNAKSSLFDKRHVRQQSLPLNRIKNDAVITLTIHFSEGTHLIKDAGSSYTLALGDNVLSNGTILSAETPIIIPKLPDTRSTLVLKLNYYFCTKKGVCLFQLSSWSIPVELSQDGLKKISITEIPDIVKKERSTSSLSF